MLPDPSAAAAVMNGRPRPDVVGPAGGLNAAQQHTLEALLTMPEERRTFPDNLADALRSRLEGDLVQSPAVMKSAKTTFGKHDISTVLACEDHHLSSKNTFAWSVATARGTLAHKAIQLGSFGPLRGRPPSVLVEAAASTYAEGWERPGELGHWLAEECSAAERSELEGEAADRVTKFQDSFPPLHSGWAPRVESAAKAELLDGNVVLRGKYDLALTLRRGDPSSTVIIDFKTGGVTQGHRDDLRFYALLETLRARVPPWRVATFDLDSATFVPEDINEGVLDAALARTVRGVTLCAELWLDNRDATRTAGAQCRWCELRLDCSVAKAFDATQPQD